MTSEGPRDPIVKIAGTKRKPPKTPARPPSHEDRGDYASSSATPSQSEDELSSSKSDDPVNAVSLPGSVPPPESPLKAHRPAKLPRKNTLHWGPTLDEPKSAKQKQKDFFSKMAMTHLFRAAGVKIFVNPWHEKASAKYTHEPGILTIITIACIIHLVHVFLHAVSYFVEGQLFNRTVVGNWDRYDILINPRDWVFHMWGPILIWNSLWVAHGLSAICRRGDRGTFVYLSPSLISPGTFFFFAAASFLSIGWILLFDMVFLWAAAVFAALATFCVLLALKIATMNVRGKSERLTALGLKADVFLMHLLMVNGLGLYAMWLVMTTTLLLAILMTQVYAVDPELSATIALGLLIADIGLWTFLDVFFWYKSTRYLCTPYLVFVVMSTAILLRVYDSAFIAYQTLNELCMGLVAESGLCLLLKFVVIVFRECKDWYRSLVMPIRTKRRRRRRSFRVFI